MTKRVRHKGLPRRSPKATEANRRRIAKTWPQELEAQVARGREETRVEQEKFEKTAERLRVKDAKRPRRCTQMAKRK